MAASVKRASRERMTRDNGLESLRCPKCHAWIRMNQGWSKRQAFWCQDCGAKYETRKLPCAIVSWRRTTNRWMPFHD
jgi:transposase-like protein